MNLQVKSDRMWETITPREWQRPAVHSVVNSISNNTRGVVQAVMGAGKSAVIAELCAIFPKANIVVSTPTRALVRQLAETIDQRLSVYGEPCGQFFTSQKVIRRVTVVCHLSLEHFAEESVEDVDIWIADEAHRTECNSVRGPMGLIDPTSRVGFTATPYLTEKAKSLSMFDHLIYRYSPAEALKDGVVVPWALEHPLSRLRQTSPANKSNEQDEGDIDHSPLNSLIFEWARNAVEHRGLDRILCDSSTIDDAESWARHMTDRGVESVAVHSGLSDTEKASRIERVRLGDAKVLVHVKMLREGVNLPWLRALMLRAPCGTRVGFAQHVGRALRSHPGKEKAIIFDPQDLFGLFRLTYEAALGETTESDEEIDITKLAEEAKKERKRRVNREKYFKRMGSVDSILRSLHVALDACGQLNGERFARVHGLSRWKRSTAKQRVFISAKGQLLRGSNLTMPAPVRVALREVWYAVPILSVSGASELIEIMDVLIKNDGWPEVANSLVR